MIPELVMARAQLTRGRDAEPMSVWLSALPRKEDDCAQYIEDVENQPESGHR